MAGLITDDLKNAFVSLFIAFDGVPNTIDINAELQKAFMKIETKKEANDILNGICSIVHALMTSKEFFEEAKKVSFSSVLYKSHQFFTDKESAQQLIPELVQYIRMRPNQWQIDDMAMWLQELAFHTLVFNNTANDRIEKVMKVFSDVFDYTTTYKAYNYRSDHDSRICECDTYKKSGDCDCPIKDVNDASDSDVSWDCDCHVKQKGFDEVDAC